MRVIQTCASNYWQCSPEQYSRDHHSSGRFNRKLVQMRVCCNRGGGGCAAVGAVTSIGSTTLLKNEQMANVLDKVWESGKSWA
jgi:hypothetical protein